ncbi:putative cysteine desulfurase [Planctomycetes bacterium Pan216]|uniref:cysteine desulfurase n=1 Tax=Kolteria novifilia TaxID=2527975 RepID=A0A518B4J3_9BACT|nr:putative cysteine desulfurase [Planctomycetes bacterium Pan216]
MIYLDHAATSFPKPEAVHDAMQQFARTMMGNPGRGGHSLAVASEDAIARTRRQLREFFNADDANRFVFTLNATDSMNMAIKGLLRTGDHVVTGVLEHNSVRRPLRGLVDRCGVRVTTVGCGEEGTYSLEELKEAIETNTRLVALTHASNVLGTVQPIEEIGAICREHGVLFMVDAAQTAGAWPIDLRELPVDLLACSGHKALLGPPGVGVLYVGARCGLEPWREGGTGGRSLDPLQPTELPAALEAGTPNVLGIVGLSAALDHLRSVGAEEIQRREREHRRQLRGSLKALPGVQVYPEEDSDGLAVVAFRADWLPVAELAALLDSAFGIAVRAGLHCAPGVHKRFDTLPDGLVRVSAGALTRESDLESFAESMSQLAGEFC